MHAASLGRYCKSLGITVVLLTLIHFSGGLLGDRVGRLNLLWPITLFSGCLSLFLWLPSNSIATLILFVCAYGFCTSSVTALPPSIIGQITPDDRLGARIGAFYSIIAVASLVGNPIGGALITNTNAKDGYRWLIVFSVSCLPAKDGPEADQIKGAALMVGSFFMLGSRLLHDSDLRRRW